MPVLVPTVEPSSPTALIETHFSKLRDPRAIHNIDHLLIDIIVITLCATICGANDWEAVAEYGRIKYEWLKKFGSSGTAVVVSRSSGEREVMPTVGQ
jgi:hypothetical protein